MAKKKQNRQNKAQPRAIRKSRKLSRKGYTIFIFCVFMGIVLMPTTILLLMGMVPTIVAIFFVVSKANRAIAVTVGAMNLAGCAPFIFELWVQGHSIGVSLSIITDLWAMVVMWSAAGVGYGLNWAVTIFMSGIFYKRGISRQKAIQKQKEELIKRWGEGVTGDLPLDEDGFVIEQEQPGEAT